MRKSGKFCQGVGGGGPTFFSHQRISQRTAWTSLEKQLDPMGPMASRWGSVPEFLRKPIATYDFPGWGSGPLSPFWIRPCMLITGSGTYCTCVKLYFKHACTAIYITSWATGLWFSLSLHLHVSCEICWSPSHQLGIEPGLSASGLEIRYSTTSPSDPTWPGTKKAYLSHHIGSLYLMLRLPWLCPRLGGHGNHVSGHCGRNRVIVAQRRGTGWTCLPGQIFKQSTNLPR